MAEKNLFTLEDLNPSTQLDSSTNLPTTNLPTTESPTNIFTLEDFEKGLPLTEDQRTRNPNPYDSMNFSNIYTDPLKKYNKYGIPLTRYNNWDESRAAAQPTWEKWGNGLVKMKVTTLGAFAENTLGIIFGLGEMAIGSGYYYDNFIGKNVDKMNEWARVSLPNYKTIEEQRMSTLQKLGTVNFWADTVANGLGYTLGSIAALIATRGVGIIGRLPKVFGVGKFAKTGMGAYNASKAIATGTQLAGATNKLSKGQRALNAINYAEVGLYMSMAEASVEARETQKRSYEDLKELERERSGYISPEKEKDILEASYSAGNTDFLLQLPVLASTNLLMFGKLMTGYTSAARRNLDVSWNRSTKGVVNNLADRGRWRNTLGRLRPTAAGAATEAAQEGWQFASKIAALDYHYDKYFDGGTEDFSKSMAKGIDELFGTQEGLESMLVGAIVGGGVSGFRSVTGKPYAERQKNAQQLTDILNGGYLTNGNSRRLNSNAIAKASADMYSAIKKGDEAAYLNAQNRLVALNAVDLIPRGGLDVFIQKMDDAAQMKDEEFAKAFGFNPEISIGAQVGKTKQEIVDDLKNKFKRFQKIYENINEAYPAGIPVPGEAGTVSPLTRMRMSKTELDAYNKQEQARAGLRTSLALSLFGIEQRNASMQELKSEMHNLLNSTVNLVNGVPILGGDFNIYDMDRPGKAETYNPQAELLKYKTREGEIIDKLIKEKADPIKIEKFKQRSKVYEDLFRLNVGGVSSYNALNSKGFFQEIFNAELERVEAEAKAKAKDLKNKEAVEKAKTTTEMEDTVEDLDGEVKSQAESKYKDLQRSEEEVKNEYLRSVSELSTAQAIQNLKNIDTSDFTDIEKAGLIRAINLLEDAVGRQDTVPPVEDVQDLDSEIFEQEQVEQDEYTAQPVDLGDQLDMFEDVTVTQTEETPLPGVELAIDPSMWTLTSRGTNKQVGVDINGAIIYSKDVDRDATENSNIIQTNIGPLLGDTKGVEVEFELIETKWFIENHKGKETENEQIPVYVKVDGVYVGKVKANTSEGRIALVNKLKAGEEKVDIGRITIKGGLGAITDTYNKETETKGSRVYGKEKVSYEEVEKLYADILDRIQKKSNANKILRSKGKKTITAQSVINDIVQNYINNTPLQMMPIGNPGVDLLKKYIKEQIEGQESKQKVTSKISSIWSNNYNNAVLSEATSTTYFYNVKDQFGDGNTSNVLLALTTGGVDETDVPQWQIVGGEEKSIANLEAVKAQAQTDQPTGTRVNQIAAVALPQNTPGGKPRIVVLSTAFLSPTAKVKVLELVTNRDYTAAKEIVASSALTRTSQGREISFLEFNVFQNGEKYLVYYSPELQKLVRVTESEMTKGLRGQSAIATIVEIKDGTYSQVAKTNELNIAQDFNAFLDTKKYHVDKELSNTMLPFTSPVTGQDYTDYQEYLFSTNEVGERLIGEGHHSILSTDMVKMDQSLFNNPKVTFERGDIMGETKQEIVDSVTFPTAEQTKDTTPQSVKDRFNKKNCK